MGGRAHVGVAYRAPAQGARRRLGGVETVWWRRCLCPPDLPQPGGPAPDPLSSPAFWSPDRKSPGRWRKVARPVAPVVGREMQKAPDGCRRGPCCEISPAASYSPTRSPWQYHRRWRA